MFPTPTAFLQESVFMFILEMSLKKKKIKNNVQFSSS